MVASVKQEPALACAAVTSYSDQVSNGCTAFQIAAVTDTPTLPDIVLSEGEVGGPLIKREVLRKADGNFDLGQDTNGCT